MVGRDFNGTIEDQMLFLLCKALKKRGLDVMYDSVPCLPS